MSTKKTVVLIDGQNFYRAMKSIGADIDFKKLLAQMTSFGDLIRVKYYACVDEDDDNSAIVPLLDWLDYNGYSVVTKYVRGLADAEGKVTIRGKVDVELSVDAMELAPHVDQIVLFSGSGEFVYLLQAIQRLGKRSVVVSSIAGNPPICADSLRRQADEFIELRTLLPRIQRDARQMTERKPSSYSAANQS